MIFCGRPRFIHYNEQWNRSLKPAADELFLNLGRSALKFLFEQYGAFYKKKLIIGLQAMNCPVLAEAILQSGNTMLLLDINLRDFSISLDMLQASDPKPDMLILNHYQGIPNQEYEAIAAYCRENAIFLIDDVSQTEHSYVGNILAGSLGDVSLHSFSLDKPFTCFEGGSLKIGNLKDQAFKLFLLEGYGELKPEPLKKVKRDLSILNIFLLHTDSNRFFSNLGHFKIMHLLFKLNFSEKQVISVLKNRPLVFAFRLWFLMLRTLKLYNPDKIYSYRLDPGKISLVLMQRERFRYYEEETEELEKLLKAHSFKPQVFEKSRLNWNKYTMLDESGKLVKMLRAAGMQAGNMNWPVPLDKDYGKRSKVLMPFSYRNSERVSRYLVNIPVYIKPVSNDRQ